MPTKKSTKTSSKKASVKSTHAKLTTWGKIWRIVICIAIPLGGGFLISMFTRSAMETFNSFKQPPLSPPAWLFPVAWSILYILMGIASFLIYYYGVKQPGKRNTSLIIYGLQLVLNFCWTIIFFNFGLFYVAFGVLIVMWALIIILMINSAKISKAAMFCLLPYLLWTTFAAYLNISIAILNA